MITFAICALFSVTAFMVTNVLISAASTAIGSYRQLQGALSSLDNPQYIRITIEGSPHFAPVSQIRALKIMRPSATRVSGKRRSLPIAA